MILYNILMIVSFICFGMVAIIPWLKGGMNTKYANIVVPAVSIICFFIVGYQIYLSSSLDFEDTFIPVLNLFSFGVVK